jgi:hypothetical protein
MKCPKTRKITTEVVTWSVLAADKRYDRPCENVRYQNIIVKLYNNFSNNNRSLLYNDFLE